jgi:hypothetical protein
MMNHHSEVYLLAYQVKESEVKVESQAALPFTSTASKVAEKFALSL